MPAYESNLSGVNLLMMGTEQQAAQFVGIRCVGKFDRFLQNVRGVAWHFLHGLHEWELP